MGKPRVFVSSTFYDLKHIRASLETFIDRLGYEPILSEKGDIAYAHDVPLDESCYRELKTADIVVLIIGGRYGSPASRQEEHSGKEQVEQYKSVTRNEYKAAIESDIPVYIFIESAVHAEYGTYLRNKSSSGIEYAHADSVEVFRFIEEIMGQQRNNPVKPFDKYEDIESWLKEQWAGLFRDFLSKKSEERQLASLSAQVAELAEISQTLKRYMEVVVTEVVPGTELVAQETERLKEASARFEFASNTFVSHLHTQEGLSIEDIRDAFEKASTYQSLYKELAAKTELSRHMAFIFELPKARRDMDKARGLLGLDKLTDDDGGTLSPVKRQRPRPVPGAGSKTNPE